LSAALGDGNVDAGVYDDAGARKGSIGSTAVGSANTAIVLDVSDISLLAGRFYMALAFDNATASLRRQAQFINRVLGIKEETSAFPLPSSATFAENATRNYIPSFGISFVT